MKLVVLSDLHGSTLPGPLAERRSEWADLLLQRAVRRINRFIRPDLVVLNGDLLEDGRADDAAKHYAVLRGRLEKLEMPWLALPGNHDAEPGIFYRHFPRPPGHVDIAGVRFIVFDDPPMPSCQARRRPQDLARSAAAGNGWRGPVVALQHVPLFPPGMGLCPYNYVNADEAIQHARRGGISLVVAGHYHPGFQAVQEGEMTFLCAPAFCESPFGFLEICMQGANDLEIKTHTLAMPEGLPLAESHVHSELAYCSEDMTMRAAGDMARLVGVDDIAFAEHSGQLYFDERTFWSAAFMQDGLASIAGRQERMPRYFELAEEAGIPPRRLGFEVDFDFQGRQVLDPEARARAGFLVGSCHWTPATASGAPCEPQACAAYHKRIWEPMLASGIDVLAHPFRIFNRKEITPPPDLFPYLAARLAATGVAAELNYHIEEPHPGFVLACLEAGVRFSLGTDSHCLAEVAEFQPHLDLLRGLGVRDSDLETMLWRP